MALRSLSRMVNGSSAKKSFLGLTGEERAVSFVPRNAQHSSVRQLAIAAAQEAAAKDGASGSLERPTSGGQSTSRRDSGRQLRTIDPLFAGLLDPFSTSNRSLKEMINAFDRMIDAPFFRTSATAIPSRMRLPQDLTEDSDAYRLRIDMPGLSKEEVKVTVEDGQLVIKGEHNTNDKFDSGWSSRSYDNYNMRLTLPEHVNIEDVKAELKNGVLQVLMPKSKEDPKKNAILIEVQ